MMAHVPDEEELGRGAFRTVSKAVDVSSGDEYAVKIFYHGDCKKVVEILKCISHHQPGSIGV